MTVKFLQDQHPASNPAACADLGKSQRMTRKWKTAKANVALTFDIASTQAV